ncbi:MAG: aminotransferase class I/II-fold pyridoxal phosphate-dependent enzyme [Lachnospiraceae bacterium]|jgi:dTDP-4-amino-4,6-dideoxygalactose transaminase|nr:aminotransferase class I/II-fold pyridoxal phosphate-dependent enzyme [Lachnospiraceae bacterium]
MFKKTSEFSPFASKVWLSSPTMHGPEMKYVTEAYQTNWMSTIGENITQAERLVCEKTGCGYAVALSSGTAALHLAVKLAGVKPHDKVLCSDLTFSATVNPVLYEGGVPVFIDAEYDTWNMDPEALDQAFRAHPEAKTVIAAHLYGTPGKMEEIERVCESHGAVLIEDAAESFGALYQGIPTGKLGKISCLSGNGNKIITGSSGGFLLTDDQAVADKARKWSTQSREQASWYQHEELGYNYRMSNVIAGVLRGQIPFLSEHIARKKEIYERYQSGVQDLPVAMNPFEREKAEPNYWLSCLLIDEEAMCPQERGEQEAAYFPQPRKSCPTELLEVLDSIYAEGRPIWKPMHLQPLYRKSEFFTREGSSREKRGKEVGTDIFERGICLPSDIKMTKEQQEKVIEVVKACFQ